jgi:hypothetical protein
MTTSLVYLSVHLAPLCQSIHLFIYLSTHPSIHPTHPSIHPSIYPSIHPSIHPSIIQHPSIHKPSMHLLTQDTHTQTHTHTNTHTHTYTHTHPLTPSKTVIAPSRTRKDLSTSTVKSTWPGKRRAVNRRHVFSQSGFSANQGFQPAETVRFVFVWVCVHEELDC